MTVLVTGGAGFIGSHVVDRLRAAAIEARIFDLRASSAHTEADVETVIGDLLDPAGLTAAMSGCDAVVHLAAAADADAVAEFPAHAEEVNSRGTLNVLEAAREAGVARVIYASTIWVYSDVSSPTVDEDTPLGLPGHLYTATKLAGEMYCRSYGELYGLEYTILRFGIPYGPRARPAAVIPTFVSKALAGEPLTIADGGRQSRRFVYVEDLADGIVRALAPVAANRTYNLVGDEDVTIRQVAETVGRAAANTQLVDVPGRSADFNGVQVSGERAARDLGWRPSTPFDAGVRRYVAWHRAQAPEAAVPQTAYELARGRTGQRRGRLLERLAQPTGMAALLLGVAVMVAALVEVLHAHGAEGDDLRTIAITSALGLTLYVSLAPDDARGSAPVFSSLGWLTAGLLVALVLVWPHDVLRLADADVGLVVLSIVGCVFGAAAGAIASWLRGDLRERAPDISG
jgi:UDP-glucose 4-epimerase